MSIGEASAKPSLLLPGHDFSQTATLILRNYRASAWSSSVVAKFASPKHSRPLGRIQRTRVL